jgi:hypothetical protein
MAIKKKLKKKYKHLVCNNCGKRRADVKECYDPYAKEVNNEEIETRLCEDCYQEKMANI